MTAAERLPTPSDVLNNQLIARLEEMEDANAMLEKENARLQCPEVEVMLIHPDAQMPTRGSEGAAGFDLYCMDHLTVWPGSRGLIDTGVALAIPQGWYGRVAPRSGLAVRNALAIHAGVIDSDFRGSVKVALFNHGDQAIEFGPGDRIAQLVIERCSTGPLIAVDYLPDTKRGHGALGSTGR